MHVGMLVATPVSTKPVKCPHTHRLFTKLHALREDGVCVCSTVTETERERDRDRIQRIRGS